MKVLFAAYEAAPLVKYGGLGDVVGSLPKALAKLGLDVRLVLPGYPFVGRKDCLPGTKIPVYYLDSPEFFGDPSYGAYNSGSRRNLHRFAFFSRMVVEKIKEWHFLPDLIHCHDWHTALIPDILQVKGRKDKVIGGIGTLLTIHNLAFHGRADPHVLAEAGLDEKSLKTLVWDVERWNPSGVRDVDFLAQGIMHAGVINTVSPSYAEEIKTAEFGEGLEDLIRARGGRVYGVLNGIDYETWNPAKDSYIDNQFDIENHSVKKDVNKKRLRQIFKLEGHKHQPLVVFIGRLAEQKGVDLILGIVPALVEKGIDLIFLGTGEAEYERRLRELSEKYPRRLAARLEFDEALAHKIYAGADLILIPSRFEPCGLVQMIAMRYGALPVARAVGGLKDTIEDGRTGFLFRDYSAAALLGAVERALTFYQDKQKWLAMRRGAMRKNFSWDQSAQEYVKLYEKVMSYKRLELK